MAPRDCNAWYRESSTHDKHPLPFKKLFLITGRLSCGTRALQEVSVLPTFIALTYGRGPDLRGAQKLFTSQWKSE